MAPTKDLTLANQKRLEVARALATDPAFILLDEPFAGVDPISVNDIKQIITHLKNRGLGVLITDHNVRETLGICKRALDLMCARAAERTIAPGRKLADREIVQAWQREFSSSTS